MELDTEKPGWELDLLDALAGTHLEVHETLDVDFHERPWIASIQAPGFGALVRGETKADARWRLVEIVALDRIKHDLEKMGWTDVENVIDEANFIVARDTAGRRWGIGASDDDPLRRAWILDQIRLEDGIEAAAVVDYRDIVDKARFVAILDAALRG